LRKENVPFVFSDRHAYLRTAQFSNDLDDLDRIIWPALQARDFKKDDADKFEKYQAEALVYKHVPVSSLKAVVCYNAEIKHRVADHAERHDADVKIIAQKKWFL